MQQHTDTPNAASSRKPIEIRSFTLERSMGLFWISYEEHKYSVTLTPYDMMRLFEIEGLSIEEFNHLEPVSFTKAILLRSPYTIAGDIFDEEGCDITPQYCWIAE